MELGPLTEDEITCWVPYGKDGRVLMRFVTLEELNALRKKATERTWIEHRLVEEKDTVKENVLLGRAAVRDWDNLTVGGEHFPYSEEKCDLLMKRSYEFSDFVNLVCIQIRFFVKEQEDESKKKSEGGPSG